MTDGILKLFLILEIGNINPLTTEATATHESTSEPITSTGKVLYYFPNLPFKMTRSI